ncbi:MAG: hypothetical protein E7294_13850 [Lachnospiraceae bacterium]|nr:hypothetical protein [Lachnospiraceae bacterium]
MIDYFSEQIEFIKSNYLISNNIIKNCKTALTNVLGFTIDENVKYIYEHYDEFILSWFSNEGKYIGEIQFVPFRRLMQEHDNLVEIMTECYDTELDEFSVVKDISDWYPIFQFTNGDAFCLDLRDGHVVLYEHEVFESGVNLHGLTIATSLNDLFDKWSKIHFADVYNWDEICNEEGIDIHSELAQKYI